MSTREEGGRNDTVIMTAQPLQKPKGFIETLADIQQVAAIEQRGASIPETFFTLKNKLDFFTVGLKGAFVSGLITALLTPFAIGVIEKKIPVFGSMNPSDFDKFFVFILALSYSIGYGIFIGSAGRYSYGNVTRSMIRNFLGGVMTGAFSKMFVAFIFFHFLYINVLSDTVLESIFSRLYGNISNDYLEPLWYWLYEFREVFIISAWFVVLSTFLFLFVPVIYFMKTYIKKKNTLFTMLRDS
jgi:hypothetical protein